MAKEHEREAATDCQRPKDGQPESARTEDWAAPRKVTKTFKADLLEELREPMVVRENGREQTISKQRAFIKALVAAAIKGDTRAINAVIACSRSFEDMANEHKQDTLDIEDLDILETYAARERKRRASHDRDQKSIKPKPK